MTIPLPTESLAVEEGAKLLLDALGAAFGLDISHPNFADTPRRMADVYQHILSGVDQTDERVREILSRTFPCESDQMIVVRDIQTFSICPHHLLPVAYTAQVAYIPSPDGQVIGLSKIPRVVELLARRPVLQEQFTGDITKALMTIDGCQGAAALVEGQHFCMIMRGAAQISARTITSSVRGAFDEEDATRAEFLELVRKR